MQGELPSQRITEGVIWKQLLFFFFPILLGSFFQQMYNTVDTIIVGRFVGTRALAAVGSTSALLNLMNGFFIGLSTGATVLLSQFYGAKSKQGVQDTLHTGVALSLVLGAVVMTLGYSLGPKILGLMNTPESCMDDAVLYIKIYFGGAIASMLYNMGAGILRAMGDSRKPTMFLMAACGVNIVLDILCVVVLKLGVAGAAIATVFSQVVSAGMVTVALLRQPEETRLSLKKIRFQGGLLKRILYVGVPAGLQFVTFDLANLLIQSGINSFGDVAVAAWTAYVKTDSLTWMISGAFGVSVTTFVGQNFGAQKYDRIRQSVWVCMGMSVVLTGAMSALVITFRPFILGIYTTDPAVIRLWGVCHGVDGAVQRAVHAGGGIRRSHAGHRMFGASHGHHLRMRVRVPGGVDLHGGEDVAQDRAAGRLLPPELAAGGDGIFDRIFSGRLAAQAHRAVRHGTGSTGIGGKRMKIRFLRLIALVLTAAVLLSGCGMVDFGEYFGAVRSLVDGNAIVPYESMTYERPDMTQLQQTLDAACEAAEGDDVSAILDGIYDFYDAYDWFSTYYALADIHYCADLTDTYWEVEYNYCAQNAATVDAALQELYRALAQSPAREKLEQDEYFGEGFFDSYEDEETVWDETFTAMLEEEARLQTRYYELSAQAADYQDDTQGYYDACADGMASLLAELIAVRQEIAEYCGYSDYPQFAEDFYFYRDYTAAEEEQLLEDIRRELVPLYRELDAGAWEATGEYASERETLNYLATAAEGMGGTVKEAHDLMKTAKLYDTGYGENKYNSSFEQYLTSYQEPFIFMNATLTAYDKLVLAHEFGHFCNDYASYGSAAGVDVSEFFSTGMEYLSLCYGGEDLTRAKMADSLGNYVEQGAYASFERQMYSLTGDALSAEGLYALYEQVALDFGFDSVGYDRREFVDVTHFYTNPMYVFSYVVSNDAAMQLYQLEQEQRGAGLELYEQNLTTEESYFLAFLDSAGLESPFEAGRISSVKAVFESVLE